MEGLIVTGAVIDGGVKSSLSITGDVMTGGGKPSPPYEGLTEVTPGDTAQVLPTTGFLLLEDITINPIPSNYGRITWNGSFLTVS